MKPRAVVVTLLLHVVAGKVATGEVPVVGCAGDDDLARRQQHGNAVVLCLRARPYGHREQAADGKEGERGVRRCGQSFSFAVLSGFACSIIRHRTIRIFLAGPFELRRIDLRERRFIDLDAQPRSLWQRGVSILVHLPTFLERAAAVIGVVFVNEKQRDGRRDMKARRYAYERRNRMRRERRRVSLRQRRHLFHLRDPAAMRAIVLDDVDAALL